MASLGERGAGFPLRVGLVGCGPLADAYLRDADLFADSFRIVALADLYAPAAQRVGADYSIPAMGLIPLLLNPWIDAVLNLSSATEHLTVSRGAVAAGKHVYAKVPLGLDPVGVLTLLKGADVAGLHLGTAPQGPFRSSVADNPQRGMHHELGYRTSASDHCGPDLAAFCRAVTEASTRPISRPLGLGMGGWWRAISQVTRRRAERN